MKLFCVVLVFVAAAWADGPGLIVSKHSKSDFDLTADPAAKVWKKVTGVVAENGYHGERVPGHRTEIRSLWTRWNIYFLFICPYEELYLKPDPVTTSETNELWKWDVAEVFIGTELNNILKYTEFEISPQGEWVDLAIDRSGPKPVVDRLWNSGLAAKARIDRENRIWYGEMKIPFDQIDRRSPREGLEMRINFYRIQGPPSSRKRVAWQPTHKSSFHVPEAFGRLKLGR